MPECDTGSAGRRPRIEFLLCGSPNDAFYSQIAFFRLSLDRLGETYRSARLVAVFGGEEQLVLPPRWERHFDRIESVYAPVESFRENRFFAAGDFRYQLLDSSADISILCDADTALVRPLPQHFLDEMKTSPAITGVVAHFPFPIKREKGDDPKEGQFYDGMPQEQAWDRLGQMILRRPIPRPLRYTLTEGLEDDRCPFYINYGFLAAPPDLLVGLHRQLEEIQPIVRRALGNHFYGQVGIALAVERAPLPWRAVPMRFNFPNDRRADRLHPEELENVVLLHYLRHTKFDRHTVFASRDSFEEFLAMQHVGSDQVFHEHVWRTTGGVYPFGGERLPTR